MSVHRLPQLASSRGAAVRTSFPFPPYRGVPFAMVPDEVLVVAALVCHGPLLTAVLNELDLRAGSDRSGPRAAPRLETFRS